MEVYRRTPGVSSHIQRYILQPQNKSVILFETGSQKISMAGFCEGGMGPSVSTKAGNFAAAMNIYKTNSHGKIPIPGVLSNFQRSVDE